MQSVSDAKRIWSTIGAALGAEVREATTIRGLSGQDHLVEAVAVDDKTNRVIVFSAESSPRLASLMQADVQATLTNAHVLVARPVIFNLAEVMRRIINAYGSGQIDPAKIAAVIQRNSKSKKRVDQQTSSFNEKVAPFIKPLFDTAVKIKLPLSVQVMDIVEQLINIDWQAQFLKSPSLEGFLQTIFSIASMDSSELDRQLGVCPIPLYELTESDHELFVSGTELDEVRDRLKALGIYQYFFPSPDHLLLGLAHKQITNDGSLVLAAEKAPAHGHPIGAPELFSTPATLMETLEELTGRGYVAEGEFGVTITNSGREIRQNIQFRPREGLISKIAKIVSVKVDLSLKDLIK
jgi:hypothetical protein